jgi:hypothetical protein
MAIQLLDDEDGISEAGYQALQEFVRETANGSCDDIFSAAHGTQGRVYLPEDHGIVA